MNTAPKVLFYVQHLLGVGHLARASRIAAALMDDGFAPTIVMGGFPVAGFPRAGIPVIALPPIKSADAAFSALVDGEGRSIDGAFKDMRRKTLLDTFAHVDPDILIIEAFPFGRRQMRFELLPLLDAAKAAGTRLIVSSVRDILQENRKAGRDAETLDTIKRYFDIVMVHGDPGFARLEDTFPPARSIAERVFYTGLVADGAPEPSPERYDVVVSAGGGSVGERLIGCALEAAELHSARWCIIGAAKDRANSLPPGVELHSFRPDFPSLLASAGVSVSQAGYNTVCDILAAGAWPVLVPFAAGGETEQTERASRLAARACATMIAEADLTPERFVDAIRSAPSSRQHGLDLDGARGTARLLREQLAIRRGR
ncbi:glycosyltransferase [soil metagenome]